MRKANPRTSVVVFSDPIGLPQCIAALPYGSISLVVAASRRPEQAGLMRTIAAESQLEVVVQPRAGDLEFEGFQERVRAACPDLILINSYSMLVPESVYGLARVAAVNVHAGLLPHYRGANPLQWAIIAGDRVTGVTMHHVSPRFDEGPVIAEKRVEIGPHETWRDVHPRLMNAVRDVLTAYLPAVLEGTAPNHPQDPTGVALRRRRHPEDGAFSWDWPLIRIYNHIRALVSPLPGAFVDEAGHRKRFDEWTSLPQLALHKHLARPGWLRPPGNFRAVPVVVPSDGSRAQRNAALVLDVQSPEGPMGQLSLSLDWEARVLRADPPRDLLEWIKRLAGEELGWGFFRS